MRIFLLLILLPLISCGHHDIDYTINHTNSSKLSYALLKATIDAALNKRSDVNTHNYVVDLSKGFDLNVNGRDSFLIEKEKKMPSTHDDSVLTPYDGNKLKVLKSMIIAVDTIRSEDPKTVRVVVRKILSDDTIVTVRLLLKRTANGYSSLSKE